MQNVSLICDKEIKTLACSTKPLSLKGGIGAETTDEGIGKSVGNLQTYAKEHGKEEEQRHALVAEELEASSPIVSTRPFRSWLGLTGQEGKDNA